MLTWLKDGALSAWSGGGFPLEIWVGGLCCRSKFLFHQVYPNLQGYRGVITHYIRQNRLRSDHTRHTPRTHRYTVCFYSGNPHSHNCWHLNVKRKKNTVLILRINCFERYSRCRSSYPICIMQAWEWLFMKKTENGINSPKWAENKEKWLNVGEKNWIQFKNWKFSCLIMSSDRVSVHAVEESSVKRDTCCHLCNTWRTWLIYNLPEPQPQLHHVTKYMYVDWMKTHAACLDM